MLNLVGMTFGRLTVIARDPRRPRPHSYWVCQCSCGQTKSIRMTGLRSGKTNSCGCLQRTAHITHGMSRTPEFRTWSQMIGRCYSPTHKQYEDYGGRGIVVSDEWRKSFMAFYEDMGPRPSASHSLDRRDNSVGYSKDNCRWATIFEQQRNRRSNRRLSHDGRSMLVVEWAKEIGLPANALEKRLSNGWSVTDALTRPRRNYPATRG